MGRYEYICRHIEVYQHEYKMLIGGKITIEQLQEECIQGFLYFFLRQFIDYVQTIAVIDDQVENTDELIEEYYWDTYFGTVDLAGNNEYSETDLNMAASCLGDKHMLLEDASNAMRQCVVENEGRVKELFDRLFKNQKLAVEFLGDTNALEHARALWDAGGFMEDLYAFALEIPETADDRVEALIDALANYEMPDKTKIDQLWNEEDLPFN